jgi:hypothetical protein
LDTCYLRPVNIFLEQSLALEQLQFPEVVSIQVKQIKSDHHDLCRFAFEFVLQHRKIRRAIGGWHHHLAVNDRGAGIDMLGIVGDLLEAVCPVVAAPGENLKAVIGEMNLHPVAVEFYFMDPALAARYLFDRGRKRRFNEAGVGRLDPCRRRLLALVSHRSD